MWCQPHKFPAVWCQPCPPSLPPSLPRRWRHPDSLPSSLQQRNLVPEHLQEKLYEELLTVISVSDDVQQVSEYLCKGAPVEPVGSHSLSALQIAVSADRSRTVNLLLAYGAALPAGLLQVAWQSRDVTPGVLAALIKVSVLPCLSPRCWLSF